MARARIQLYYDIISPYSYLAFEALTRYTRTGVWDVELQLCPAALGGVHKIAGVQQITPAVHPLKKANMHREMRRLFAEYGIEGSIPETHPFEYNTLGIMRFLRVLQDSGDSALLEACSRRLFDQLFRAHTKPADASFLGVLAPSLLTNAKLEQLIAKSVEPENKKRLADEAAALVQTHGAFGFPWIVVQRADGAQESWFGSDRFGNIAWWLGEGFEWSGPNPKQKAAL